MGAPHERRLGTDPLGMLPFRRTRAHRGHDEDVDLGQLLPVEDFFLPVSQAVPLRPRRGGR